MIAKPAPLVHYTVSKPVLVYVFSECELISLKPITTCPILVSLLESSGIILAKPFIELTKPLLPAYVGFLLPECSLIDIALITALQPFVNSNPGSSHGSPLQNYNFKRLSLFLSCKFSQKVSNFCHTLLHRLQHVTFFFYTTKTRATNNQDEVKLMVSIA